MSEEQVDLSQIRGDWYFHMNYVTNAITQTLKRQKSLWDGLDSGVRDPDVDEAVQQQQKLWGQLIDGSDGKGVIPLTDQLLNDYIEACRSTKTVCDGVLDKSDSLPVEEFSEACRQARALCDDLELMRETRPNA